MNSRERIVVVGNVKIPVPVPPMSSGSVRFSRSVRPCARRVGALVDIELVDDQAPLIGVRDERPFEHRIEEPSVVGHRHPFEALAARQVRRGAAQERIVGRLHAGQRDRGLEHAAARVGVDQKRPELVAEPERPVGHLTERLDIEVGAGECSAYVLATA